MMPRKAKPQCKLCSECGTVIKADVNGMHYYCGRHPRAVLYFVRKGKVDWRSPEPAGPYLPSLPMPGTFSWFGG